MNSTELDKIKAGIEINIGKRVWLKANRGRSRCVISEGILENTFSSVFTVAVGSGLESRKLSYTYGDILTKSLEMKLLE